MSADFRGQGCLTKRGEEVRCLCGAVVTLVYGVQPSSMDGAFEACPSANMLGLSYQHLSRDIGIRLPEEWKGMGGGQGRERVWGGGGAIPKTR